QTLPAGFVSQEPELRVPERAVGQRVPRIRLANKPSMPSTTPSPIFRSLSRTFHLQEARTDPTCKVFVKKSIFDVENVPVIGMRCQRPSFPPGDKMPPPP